MVDKIVSLLTTALVITGVGIAVRPGSKAPAILRAGGNAMANIQTAAYGPTK